MKVEIFIPKQPFPTRIGLLGSCNSAEIQNAGLCIFQFSVRASLITIFPSFYSCKCVSQRGNIEMDFVMGLEMNGASLSCQRTCHNVWSRHSRSDLKFFVFKSWLIRTHRQRKLVQQVHPGCFYVLQRFHHIQLEPLIPAAPQSIHWGCTLLRYVEEICHYFCWKIKHHDVLWG